MPAYYNEIDQGCCDWLSNLMDGGLITPGKIDNRSIADVNPDDLAGFRRVHFFSGIGGWDLALQQAGWPEERPVWTGSCPCQPFSAAGSGKGFADKRHLWPEMFRLIKKCRPSAVFGEQVAQKAGAAWFDTVQADLEKEDYACGMAVFPACGLGSAHLRQRLYWVARTMGNTYGSVRKTCDPIASRSKKNVQWRYCCPTQPGSHVGLADMQAHGKRPLNRESGKGIRQEKQTGGQCVSCGVADHIGNGLQGRLSWRKDQERESFNGSAGCSSAACRPDSTNGHWKDPDWIFCQDNKLRPVEPGSSPLAYGVPGKLEQMRSELQKLVSGSANLKDLLRECKKVLREARGCRNQQLKGYGNAIVIPQAVAFIESYIEVNNEEGKCFYQGSSQ